MPLYNATSQHVQFRALAITLSSRPERSGVRNIAVSQRMTTNSGCPRSRLWDLGFHKSRKRPRLASRTWSTRLPSTYKARGYKRKPQISPLRCAPVEMTKSGLIANQAFLNQFHPLAANRVPQVREANLGPFACTSRNRQRQRSPMGSLRSRSWRKIESAFPSRCHSRACRNLDSPSCRRLRVFPDRSASGRSPRGEKMSAYW